MAYLGADQPLQHPRKLTINYQTIFQAIHKITRTRRKAEPRISASRDPMAMAEVRDGALHGYFHVFSPSDPVSTPVRSRSALVQAHHKPDKPRLTRKSFQSPLSHLLASHSTYLLFRYRSKRRRSGRANVVGIRWQCYIFISRRSIVEWTISRR